MGILRLILAAAIAAAPMATMFPGPAAAQSGRPGGAVDTEAEAMALLGEVIAWSQPITALISKTSDLGLSLVEASSAAVEPDKAGPAGGAWASEWQVGTDAELARLKVAAATLPAMPAGLQARYRSMGPTAARQLAGFQAMPDLARDLLRETESQIEVMRPLIIEAASGDPMVKAALARKLMIGSRLLLKSENAMADLSIAIANTPSHPQVGVSKAGKASNEALIEIFLYLEAALAEDGPDPDTVAAGKAVAAKVAEARKGAAEIWPNALAMNARLSRQLPPGVMRTALGKAMATYEESAKVEMAIADTIEKISENLLGDPDAIDIDSWPLDELDALVKRRVALYEQRVSLFQAK